jgi:hypothetical protein
MRTNKTYKTFSVGKTYGFPGDRLILAVIETYGWEMNSGLNRISLIFVNKVMILQSVGEKLQTFQQRSRMAESLNVKAVYL